MGTKRLKIQKRMGTGERGVALGGGEDDFLFVTTGSYGIGDSQTDS